MLTNHFLLTNHLLTNCLLTNYLLTNCLLTNNYPALRAKGLHIQCWNTKACCAFVISRRGLHIRCRSAESSHNIRNRHLKITNPHLTEIATSLPEIVIRQQAESPPNARNCHTQITGPHQKANIISTQQPTLLTKIYTRSHQKSLAENHKSIPYTKLNRHPLPGSSSEK